MKNALRGGNEITVIIMIMIIITNRHPVLNNRHRGKWAGRILK